MTPTWEGFRNATEGAIASHPTDLNFEDVLAQAFGLSDRTIR